MKLLWIDDNADDALARELFVEEWKRHVPDEDMLFATTADDALQRLASHDDVALIIIDLLWGDDPEHARAVPTGVDVLRRVRAVRPGLPVVVRSKMSVPSALMARVPELVELETVTHVGVGETDPQGHFRRALLWESAKRKSQRQALTLASRVGEQWCAVMFADISGFTSSTETLWRGNRTVLMERLASFYNISDAIVTKYGGVVDKLIGDEVMALFVSDGAPQTTACRAVDAAVEIRNEFLTVAREFQRATDSVIDPLPAVDWELKIGLEAGTVVIAEHRLPSGQTEICTIGVAVNLASRIKGAHGKYPISIGPTLRRDLPNSRTYATVAYGDPLMLKGFAAPVIVYRLEHDVFATVETDSPRAGTRRKKT